MPVKKNKKMDDNLVAAKQNHESEVKYVAARFKATISVVRKAMKDCGKNGKPSRSRKMIYAKLRELGYEIVAKDKKPKKVVVELLHDKKGNLIS